MIKLGLLSITTLLLLHSQHAQASEQKYFKNLRYNHVSLHVPIKGILPISAEQAEKESHYVFHYDGEGRITEIINNKYGRFRRHPLTHFGAHKITFDYQGSKEVRTYFDIKGKPMKNIRGVHKEVFSLDTSGFKRKLDFYDKDNQPVESNWKIANYTWQQQDGLVVEQRFDLKGEAKALSPYFAFGTTGIIYDNNANPIKHINLDESEKIVNAEFGVAFYRDEYDERGLHISYSYFDNNNDAVLSPFGFHKGIKQYDEQGKQNGMKRFDAQGQEVKRLILPAVEPASEEERKVIKQTALNYLIALQTLNPDLMEATLHKSLAKSFVSHNREGKTSLRFTTFEQMIGFAENWNKAGTRFPNKPSNKAEIMDVYNNMAAVKLTSDNWVEYLHLVKVDGKWRVKDLVWDYNNI